MAITKTIEFLPAVFQSDANRKFLNATLDQLVSEPKLNRVNGYIGRKFSPTHKSTDKYVIEGSALRSNYQLEPSIVVKNQTTNDVDFYATYPELLQKINYYNGNTNNQNALWESEYYSYNPHIDLDKFINFSQYYWLPDGPDAVNVQAGTVDLEHTYQIVSDTTGSVYNVSGFYDTPNPDIVLGRNGVYKFVVNQPGKKFWIQTSPGMSGRVSSLIHLSSRNVLGVENNGADVGVVTFTVPSKTAQDFYINMPKVRDVDFATPLSYNQIQNRLLSSFLDEHGGVDGQQTQAGLDNKYIVFANPRYDDLDWTAGGLFDGSDPTIGNIPFDYQMYDQGSIVPSNNRYGIWQIKLVPVGELPSVTDYVITLQYVQPIPLNNKVLVKGGLENGGTEWYYSTANYLQMLPLITANLDTLYYQDSENPSQVGIIRLVEPSNNTIDVTVDILGKTKYVSPNGVVFTDGMKISLDSSAVPSTYANKEFYVEGVGTGISLIEVSDLKADITGEDYLVMNRASQERSPWTRGNRWFHKDVIRAAAYYNNTAFVFNQDAQARRPIIEFEANLQLFDFGYSAKTPVDVYDNVIAQPFVVVEGKPGFYIDGVELKDGMRVIFAADQDPATRNNIWVVKFVDVVGVLPSDPKQIHFVLADDGEVNDGDTVLVKSGINQANKNYWFTGGVWKEGQSKTKLNQAPFFDVYDYEGSSFGDQSKYPTSNIIKFFTGNKVFSYAVGSGSDDPVLGFPLVYKNFNNVGDIKFENNFDSEIFQYVIDQVNYTKKVNTGLLRKTNGGTVEYVPIWNKVDHPSTQYQHISYTYDGVNNYFFVDVLPAAETTTKNLMIYVNSKQLTEYQYVIETLPGRGGFNVFVSRDVIAPGWTVDILINSDSVSKLGYFQVPTNLNFNAQNSSFTELTLGELRNHIGTIAKSSLAFNGTYPGSSNLRDIDVSGQAGVILQQTAGIPYASMFLNDEKANFVNAVTYAAQEYTRFKNKFLEVAATNSNIAYETPRVALDQILAQINMVKNKTFPWFYSDMIPYGDEKNTITYNVFDPAVKNYEMTTVFDINTPSSRAILVYVNGIQLSYGRDYTIPADIAAVTISNSFTLNVNDVLEIVEYSNTDGCYVPETPSKMGIYPKVVPEIYTDNTYRTPVVMIKGHDGSLTPAFGDFRDALLLELENRIFNNIKATYDEKEFGIHNTKPGKFRNTGYNLTDFNRVLSRTFLNWVGLNRLDYSSNTTWDLNDPFTWNYRTINDITGEKLPGSWRACYDYYYDTWHPNTTPWEMLGFSERPDWWVSTYGPAPYTGGNLVMWQHLEQGYIAGGPRKGIDPRFARPGLLDYIPVNANGELNPPAGLMALSYLDTSTNSSWAASNQSPVETAWRTSSEYPFAMQIAMAVTKPARYFGLYLNTQLNKYVDLVGQYQNIETRQRMVQDDVVINGSTDDYGNIRRASGYLNWIADYLRNMGINPQVTLGHFIKDFNIQLSYRLAGYSDKNNLKVLAEQNSPNSINDSIIIPDSDYDLILNKSVPTRKLTYSAVIVERTTQGYKVSGYDTTNPVFTIIPPDPGGETYQVSVLNESATIYKKYRSYKLTVPYGFEFKTTQQVVNFLTSYGLALTAQGFKFDEYDQNLEEIRNWVLSVKEFLYWAQQGWSEGNALVLSPVADKIRVVLADAVIDKVTNSVYGSKIVNQNFQTLKTDSYNVIRDGNIFECSVINQDTIAYAELNAVQYEHALIFNNTTMFNDTIYVPSVGARQYRLKLVGFKTSEWTGNFNPQGFIFNNSSVDKWQPGKDYLKGDLVDYKGLYYTASADLAGMTDFNFANWIKIDQSRFKTGLLNNFATNSQISEQFYNVDGVNLESQSDLFGKGLIGYKNRNYLNSLELDDTSQVKFYQGFIKDKGTQKALNALSSLQSNNIESNIKFLEEWAFRIGEYGALDINQFVEVNILDQDVLSDPISIEFVSGNSTDGTADIEVRNPYKTSEVTFQPSIFLNRTATSNYITDIATAGFVNLEDVDVTVFDITNTRDLTQHIGSLGSGTRIWCAKDFSSDWNVFRVSETKISVVSVTNALDGYVEMMTNAPHGLVVGDIVMIKSAAQFTGFYFINRVTATNKFIVDTTDSEVNLNSFGTLTGIVAPIHTLVSMRFEYASDINSVVLPDGWKKSEFAWVSKNTTTDWGVYKKTSPWEYQRLLAIGEDNPQVQFGSAVSLSLDTNFALIGKPYQGSGVVSGYAKSFANRLTEKSAVTPTTQGTLGFGQVLDQGTHWSVVGAPRSDSNRGHVFTMYRDNYGDVTIKQVLVAPDSVTGALFGTSVTISRDDQWIYVGAPGVDAVYAFGYVPNTIVKNDEIRADGVLTQYTLRFIPDSIDSLIVGNTERTYLPYIDYTLVDSATVQFTTPPSEGVIAVTQQPGFRFAGKMSGTVGTNFGFSVACATDGAQVIIGAPLETVSGKTKSGAAYVYDRSIEAFFADGTGTTFATQRPLVSTTKVYVNGTLQGRDETADTNPSYVFNTLGQVQFFEPPYPGSTVTVETNEFKLIEKQLPDTPMKDAQFGYCVDLCPTNCSLYIGSPYFNDGSRNAGAVYRFFNQGRTYGTILGSNQNPSVTSGSSIRIENFEIQFIQTSLNDVVAAINHKNIPGVTAVNENGYLRINSNVVTRRNKLPITPGVGNAIAELGLDIYPQIQLLTNPYSSADEFFGKKVKITRQLPYDNTLVVSSEVGTTYRTTTYDSNTTTFDNKSTNMLDPAHNTGAVYIFEYLGDSRNSIEHPGKFTFIQQLVPSSPVLTSGDEYGYDFDVMGGTVLVGAPKESSVFENSGQVFVFENPTGSNGWQLVRQEEPKVDIDAINRFYLYNKKSNTIVNSLDYIDPAKGKILGNAEQEIKYKTVYDPANYNRGTNSGVTITEGNHWSDKQVGQVWWDLDTVRYVDYEQGSVSYRTTNWGKMFPGSSVDVYEWVESSYLPSQYVLNGGNGVPKHEDNSAYVELQLVDASTGGTYSKYFYWVKDKTTVDANQFGRTIPVSNVRDLIENPKGQGVEYAAAIKNNAVSLFNVSDKITSDDIVLHIDYDTQLNTSLIHSEWQLVSEGADLIVAPPRILAKIIDSICGADEFGNIVPDPMLAVQNKYGINIRPRQTMFVDRVAALKVAVDFLNAHFLEVPTTHEYDISLLYNQEPIPPVNSGAWDIAVADYDTLGYIDINIKPVGFNVLVESDNTVSGLWTIYTKLANNTWFLVKVQSFNASSYWNYADWYAEGYSASTVPTYTVATPADIAKLNLVSGDIVKINNDGTGNFKIIQISPTKVTTIGLQNGTVQLSSSLYDLETSGAGFDNYNFGSNRFDQNPSIEVRAIVGAIVVGWFDAANPKKNAELFFTMIHYIMSEQKYVDWVFKTSFINVLHKIRKLNQPATYIRDNQEYYLEYINEVKPYHTTIREYVMDYEGVDNINGYVTDFDLPAYYDQRLGMYRSPSGEYVQDMTALQSSDYADWLRDYTYSIPTGMDSVVLARSGAGYLTKPIVKILGSMTGDNAEAEAVFDYSSGKITAINVTKSGSGYTGRTLAGDPLPAVVVITGGSLPQDVVPFGAGVVVAAGDIVFDEYALRYYQVLSNGTLSAYRPTHTASVMASAGNFQIGYQYKIATLGDTDWQAIGAPAGASVGTTFIATGAGTGTGEATTATAGNGTTLLEYYGEQATAYINLKNNTIRKLKTTLTFDRMTYSSTVKMWEPGASYKVGDIVVYNNTAYQATADFTSGTAFVGTNLRPYTFVTGSSVEWSADTVYVKNELITHQGSIYIATSDFTSGAEFDSSNLAYYNSTTANDRVRAYYAPGAGLPGRDFSLLEEGINYPGVQIAGPLYADDPKFDTGGFDMMSFDNFDIGPDGTIELSSTFLDSVIQSEYTDAELGTRPEDIIVDGGAFVDAYSSHAPEELIPGRVFDTLDLQVYQTVSPNADNLSIQGVTIQFLSYTITEPLATYSYNLGAEYNDVIFVYTGQGGRLEEGVDYTINWFDKTITTTKSLFVGDILFIYSFNQVGANEKTEVVYRGTGAQTNFDLLIPNTFNVTALVLVNGQRTDAYTIIDGAVTKNIVFDSAPAADDYIHILVFEAAAIQPFSEIHTQRHIVTQAGSSAADYTLALDRTIVKSNPFATNLIVELGKSRLRPPTAVYYSGNGATLNYAGPQTAVDINGATIVSGDVQVWVDGVLQVQGVDYTLNTPCLGSALTVAFNNAPLAGQNIVVVINKFAQYTVNESTGTSITITGTVISQDDIISVISFANHDLLGIKTHVFLGSQVSSGTTTVSFDSIQFDDVAFDTDSVEFSVAAQTFNISSPMTNQNYAWVTFNGKRLLPNYDFFVDGTKLTLASGVTVSTTDVLVITEFGINPIYNPISWRQFKTMSGHTEFLRMAVNSSTHLVAELGLTDTTIYVDNSNHLPDPSPELAIPGVVFVNGERITYYAIDREAHTLSQLRRGTAGTGAATHAVGSRVDDGSQGQIIPRSSDTYGVALFQGTNAGDGTNKVFTTTLTGETALHLTSEQVSSLGDLIVELDNPLYSSIEDLIPFVARVYVGGTELRYDNDMSALGTAREYSVSLVSDTLDGNAVYRFEVTLNSAPAAGVWVAVEIRTNKVWFDIGGYSGDTPTSSALANSSTQQALFLKTEAGFLP